MHLTKAQMMALVAQGRIEESYTFEDEGKLMTYNVTRMRKKAQEEKREVTEMDVPSDFIQELRASRDIEEARILDPLDIDDPAIIVEFIDKDGLPVQHMIIDGAHRILRRLEHCGKTTLLAYVFKESEAILCDQKTQVVLTDMWGEKGFFENRGKQ